MDTAAPASMIPRTAGRVFRGYTWRDLPAQWLRSYTAPEKIKRADEAARRRTGGVPWAPPVPPGGLR